MKSVIRGVSAIQDYVVMMSGYPFQAAGGCVRDALWGRIPKDYDMVYCPGDIDDAEAFKTVADLAKQFRANGWCVEVYQAYGQRTTGAVTTGSFESMFYACLKLSGHHMPDIDILLSRYASIDEHVQHHDCNANMVYLTPKGDAVGCVRPMALEFRTGIDATRIEYMTQKYNTIITESTL